MMDDIFDDLITEGVMVVYLDDILIFTETLEEHRRVTRRVMELLRKNNLLLKPEKCEFEKTEVEYLGVIISQNSVKMDPVKVAGVTEWPIPSNRKEVQSFLGFTNFYRRFIQGFSHLARPLFNLTWKDTEWRWGYRSPLDRDHSADFTERADEPCNSLAAFATGSSFSPSRVPFRMSFRIPRSSPAASKPSNAQTAKKFGVRRTMFSLSSEPVL